jgi:SAM-dependent methyltransferase
MTSPKKCILCNNSSVFDLKFTKTYKKMGKRDYFRCPECDLIFVPEKFHLSSIDEEARYLLHNNTLSNAGYVNMFMEKIKLIKQYCPGIMSALDYGCGHEPVLKKLLQLEGYDCDGYDLYFNSGFPVRSYDLVISTEVFEHFRDIRNELTKIHSLLRPGGFLAIMTSFHDPAEDFENWWYHSDPTHICFFSMKTFDWISKQFGFKKIYSNEKNFIILQLK